MIFKESLAKLDEIDKLLVASAKTPGTVLKEDALKKFTAKVQENKAKKEESRKANDEVVAKENVKPTRGA